MANWRSNPFDDATQEIDDDFFFRDHEQQARDLLAKKHEIENRTVRSTERSLSYLRNSEQVGIATAEELVRQREKLEKTEKNLDQINSTLRISQRHIQGIKSIFGGLKNIIVGSKTTLPKESSIPESSSEPSASTEGLSRYAQEVQAKLKDVDEHPAMKLRNPPVVESTSKNAQDIIDNNLGEMLTTITRLKGLAQGLGEEIESQNELLDNVADKTEHANITITKQKNTLIKLNK